jgi:hypothetical protein|tara:strand:- start:796 stop:945 length:150 start_codon:yes stop_codon:yes gene_type:complete
MNNTMPAMEVSGVLQTFGRGIEVPMKQTETVNIFSGKQWIIHVFFKLAL